MWAALSALFVVFLVSVTTTLIWVFAKVIGFLQPILIPVAIAAILAYLLDPVVTRMCRGGMGRTKAVSLLFLLVFLFLVAGTNRLPRNPPAMREFRRPAQSNLQTRKSTSGQAHALLRGSE